MVLFQPLANSGQKQEKPADDANDYDHDEWSLSVHFDSAFPDSQDTVAEETRVGPDRRAADIAEPDSTLDFYS